MTKVDLVCAGVLIGAALVAVPVGIYNWSRGSPAEERLRLESHGWKRYAEGVTEGSRQATLKCPYNYRMKP